MAVRSLVNRQLRKFEKSFETFNEITISRSALLHNFDFFQSLVPDGSVIPVLKSNAYGHGIPEITEILKARSFPYIAVDGFYESLAIHSVSKQPVLVMGAIKPDNFKRMNFKRLAIVVHDSATVAALGRLKRPVKVHIELETGMARHGVAAHDLSSFLSQLKTYKNITVEGVMTHLADADNPTDTAYNVTQTARFDEGVELILAAGIKPRYFHIAQSAGSTKIISRHANALRIGIALYGVSPLDSADKQASRLQPLRPVLQLTTTITKVLDLQAGDTVSYGRTFTAKQPTRIGVLPLGYYEGLPRSLSNVGLVQVGKEFLLIAGRVCMNHTMIELGAPKASVGTKVTVISRDPSSKVSLAAICQQHELFNYGLLVGLNQNIRRKITA